MRVLLSHLIQCRIISETIDSKTKNIAYQPAQHIDNLSVSFIINSIDNLGTSIEPNIPEMERILKIHGTFTEKIDELKENVLVKEI